MVSLRARIIRFISRRYFKRVTPDSDVHKMRSDWEAVAEKAPIAPGVKVTTDNIEGIDCEWLVPEGCEDAPLIYYLHGGAYLMGSPQTHRRMVSYIARESGMRALLPDYRLAPEHRFPAALEDAKRIYRALAGAGMDPARMAIAGDSAGGNLSMATLLSLRDEDEQLPAACFLLSPWLDLVGDGESHQTRSHYDPWFRTGDLPAIAGFFCDDSELRNPLVSPVYADASGLPPTLIQVGDHEILLSDSTRLADNMTHGDGDVTLQVWPGMWHVFQFFVGQMPESMRAIRDIAGFLESRFSVASRHTSASGSFESQELPHPSS